MPRSKKMKIVTTNNEEDRFPFSIEPYRTPLIEKLLSSLPSRSISKLSHIYKDTYLVGAQHLMDTEICVFDALIRLGIEPENMRFTGKLYSDYLPAIQKLKRLGINIHRIEKQFPIGNFNQQIRKTVKSMWRATLQDLKDKPEIKNIILLDEGGRCLEEMPKILSHKYNLIVIEHTRGGLYSNVSRYFDGAIIKTAMSAAKKELESPKIIKAVVERVINKISVLDKDQHYIYGIVGLGALGLALAKNLSQLGYNIYAHDKDPLKIEDLLRYPQIRTSNHFEKLVYNVDVLIGTTGTDISSEFNFKDDLTNDIILISCSSEDKEYKTLLKSIDMKKHSPFDDLVYHTETGDRITLLSGGFPINFDGGSYSVPLADIAITRALITGSVIQAGLMLDEIDFKQIGDNNSYSVDYQLQQFIALEFIQMQAKSGDYTFENVAYFESIAQIKAGSDGTGIELPDFASLSSHHLSLDKKNFSHHAG
jgi:hypothetical protein